MATQPSTTRRALFAAPVALALAALPAAAASPISPAWRRMIADMGWLHPNGRAVAEMAQAAGFDVHDIASISLGGKEPRNRYPVIFFDAHNGGYHSVSPSGVLDCGNYIPVDTKSG